MRFGFQHTAARRRLLRWAAGGMRLITFQHTAARRRLRSVGKVLLPKGGVSTHSRPKAAATGSFQAAFFFGVSTHSRPKAAAKAVNHRHTLAAVSTHSRPKAAAVKEHFFRILRCCFNTQPPEGGCKQHAVAVGDVAAVSTHSRPKAAAAALNKPSNSLCCFNTQPPEGGC